jgi:anthranilate synthase component 2
MSILVLDNYDSFTYNLVHIIQDLGYGDAMDVFRNDKITLEAVDRYQHILLSPGPGIPSEAGIMLELIRRYGAHKNILGICLGHQGIGEVYGGTLYNLPEVFHGVSTSINIVHSDDYLFKKIPPQFKVCRYHSWAIQAASVSGKMQVSALDGEGIVMGLRHQEHQVRGLQFHPESILTEHGKQLICNWLENDGSLQTNGI